MDTIDMPQLLAEVMQVMEGLSDEWEYSGPVTPDTRFITDMELQSLDFVILSTSLVRKYGRIPFDELYTDLAEREPEDKDITVREYAEFVHSHLPAKAAALDNRSGGA